MINILKPIIYFLAALTGVSGFVGAAILIFSGDWVLVIKLFIGSAIAPFVLSLPMLPAGLFVALGGALSETASTFSRLISSFFEWLGIVYIGVIFAIWSVLVLQYVNLNLTSDSFWGAILSIYATAIGPLMYMSSKNLIEDEIAAFSNMMSNFASQLSLFVMLTYPFFIGFRNIYESGIIYVLCFSIVMGFTQIYLWFNHEDSEKA